MAQFEDLVQRRPCRAVPRHARRVGHHVPRQRQLNEADSPRVKRVIGIFAFDEGSDGVTDLSAPLPEFYAQTFITGMDVYIPARGHTGVAAVERGTGTVLPIPA
ncbi:hypothetical protein [Dactylosporangium sp. NPDC006015]|uniref:hypothetical protein n=1 Tax=Dactylosporangium sp. NPDC006015 TaxID=3154576 RepID=UPI0033A157C0